MFRAKLFKPGAPLALSDMLPLFENMGVQVADERPYKVGRSEGGPAWIYDFGLVYAADEELETGRSRRRSRTPFSAPGGGTSRTTPTTAWSSAPGSRGARSPSSARSGSTCARPERGSATATSSRPSATTRRSRSSCRPLQRPLRPAARDRDDAAEVAQRIGQAIDAVESLEQDQILRTFLDVLQAMLRTNYFQRGGRPAEVALLLQARPVAAPVAAAAAAALRDLRLLTAHRGGAPARRQGGSGRLALVRPARGLPHRGAWPDEGPDGQERGDRARRREGRLRAGSRPADRDELSEVVACYRTFIRGLLDLTDNIVDGEIAPPAGVVRYDEDDPYLVVAADKGTATFSDIANGISDESRLLARRRLRLGRRHRLRPQGDGHHRARRLGVRQAPLPRARARRAGAGLHGGRHRRHVR